MNYEQLKNSILGEAICGQLVPQDPNDEPASVLLDRIAAEKDRLVKEKKIKADKNASRIYRTSDGHYVERFADKHRPETCIDDEIPFDIPETWELVRLGNIAQLNMGKTPERGNAAFWSAKDFPWVSIADMIPSGITIETKEYVSKDAAEKCFKGGISKKGSLLMSFKLTIGRTTILGMDAYHNEAIITIIPHYDKDYYLRDYLFIFLPMLANQGDSKEAIKGKTLNSKSLYNILVPLPPLSEQHRIVEKLEEILPKVEEYGKAQDRLDALNKALPEKLKASILQEAIEGRLVPQDPDDEPASVLLDRIAEEKDRLVKEKKIKADKSASRIYRTADGHWMERFADKHRSETCIDDEIPFDIPETWELVRLGNIAQLNMGKTPERGNAAFWSAKDFPWVSIADMIPSGITIETKEYVSKDAAEKCFKGGISKKGSLLMSFKLTIGRTTILGMDAYHNEAIITIIPHYDKDYYLRDYLFIFLPMLANQGDSKEAIKGKTLNSKSLYNILVPLPPLSEQHRIVEKLEEILPKVEALW